MTLGQSGQTPEPRQPFEHVARAYETWYETRRGQRADQAERVLLEWLVGQGPGAETLLEVGWDRTLRGMARASAPPRRRP